MRADELDVHFIGAQYVTDQQIVRTIVTQPGSEPGHTPGFRDDDVVGIQKPGDLSRRLFAAARWTFDSCGSGDIVRHRDTHPSENLNAFRDRVYKFNLLVQIQRHHMKYRTIRLNFACVFLKMRFGTHSPRPQLPDKSLFSHSDVYS